MSSENGRLAACELRKAFRGRVVVDGVSLEVRPGEIVGLLGPNGAGKTTCFGMVMGLLRADGGRVLLGERDITAWPMHRRALAGIGYLAQEPSVFLRLSVRDNLRLYLEAARVERAEAERRMDEALRDFDLLRLQNDLGRTLSGGERRRLEIARATIQRPAILLLDEPFSGIDPLAVEEIRRHVLRLASRGVGVLLTDHNVRETLSTCQRAYIVKDGRIIEAGSPEEIARSERARSAYLGESFRLE